MGWLICGLIYGFGGRAKASHWELLEGRFLICQEELGLPCSCMSYQKCTLGMFTPQALSGDLSCPESDQVTSKIFQTPRSIRMIVKNLFCFVF